MLIKLKLTILITKYKNIKALNHLNQFKYVRTQGWPSISLSPICLRFEFLLVPSSRMLIIFSPLYSEPITKKKKKKLDMRNELNPSIQMGCKFNLICDHPLQNAGWTSIRLTGWITFCHPQISQPPKKKKKQG